MFHLFAVCFQATGDTQTTKPPINVFKAIFESSESEESSSEETAAEEDKTQQAGVSDMGYDLDL